MNQAKNALLIGATQGIGRETARLLADQAYHVLLIGRNQLAGDALARELGGQFIQADMSLLSEVRRVADLIKAQLSALDLIIHSADVLLTKRETTAEGHERSIATNYLSRFLLNSLLLDRLRQGERPRIIHVAAAGLSTTITPQNFPLSGIASSFTGHNLGQAANDFYGLAFKEHYESLGICINILNPGMVDTGIRRKGGGGPMLTGVVRVLEMLMRPLMTSPRVYADLVVSIALGQLPAADQSVLLDRTGKPIMPRRDRLDRALREYVWQQTEALVEVSTFIYPNQTSTVSQTNTQMSKLFSQPIDGNCLLAGLVFAGHIAGNLWIAQGSAGQFTRFQSLSLFPPSWVFSIWLPIWTLQAILLYQSYGSGFWTAPLTGLFVLICVGNLGSQFAGFQNLSWVVYIGFIACMFVSSLFFAKTGEQSDTYIPVFNAAAQLYVGWASIALVVGMGVILVCDHQLIKDAIYSRAGLLLLGIVPIVLWSFWVRGVADYRVITLPYLLVLLALGIRIANAGGQFLRM